MTDAADHPVLASELVSEALKQLLDQLPTLRVADIRVEAVQAVQGTGSVARMTVLGGRHEIVCELNARGDLLSARVIEL